MILLMTILLWVGLVVAPLAFAILRPAPAPSRLRLAQARHRLGRLAGPTRDDFLLSEGMPIVDPPDKMRSARRALTAGLRWDEESRCYVASNGRRITEEAWEAIS